MTSSGSFYTSIIAAIALIAFILALVAPIESSPRPISGSSAPLTRRALHSFTSDELVARYELMVQYKYGNISSCPAVWRYSGNPEENNGTVILAHRDISISVTNDTPPVFCGYNPDGNNKLELLSSSHLIDHKLDSFEASIANNVDKTTVFDSLHAQLTGRLYLLSAVKDLDPIKCGAATWFDNEELFIFFDEAYTIMLSVVSKIQNGGPRILTLPLIGRIRYMLSVTTGSTCIYRVQSDVREVLMNPSKSPVATLSPSPEANTTAPLIPSSSPIAVPSTYNVSASPTSAPLADTPYPTVVVPPPGSTPIPSMSTTPSPAETPHVFPPSLTKVPTTTVSTTAVAPVSVSALVSTTVTPAVLESTSASMSASVSASTSASVSASVSASISASALASALASAFASILASTSATISTSSSPAPTISVLPQIESPSPSMSASASMSSLPLPSSSPSLSPMISMSTVVLPSVFNDPTSEPHSPDVSGDASQDAELDETEEDIEASNGPDGSEINGGQTCFPASARVTLENGRSVSMAELRIGDRVYVGGGRFSPVTLFTHRDPTVQTTFVVARTANGATLRVTPGHFVYVNGKLKPMREILVGDSLVVQGHFSDGGSNGSVVVEVKTSWDSGIYNPQTKAGYIFVDNVKASCYTEAVRLETAHSLLAPIRAVAHMVSNEFLDLISTQIEQRRQLFLGR